MESIEFFVDNKSAVTLAHVITVIIGMGSALSSDLLFSFYGRDKVISGREAKNLERLSSVVWIALIGIILSGLALFFSDPSRYLGSDKFITKMSIMLVLLVNGVLLSKIVFPHVTDRGFLKFKSKQSIRKLAFVGGAVSVSSWFVVCGLGLLKSIPVSVMQALVAYVFIVTCSVLVALYIEQRTFER